MRARRAFPGSDCGSRAQLETLDFTRSRLRQLVDELDPARILVRRELRLDVRAELLRERIRTRLPAFQHDIGDRLRQVLVVLLADYRGLEHGGMRDQRRLDLDRRNVDAADL